MSDENLLIIGGKRMFLLLILFLAMLLFIKGFFKIVLPALIILMILKFLKIFLNLFKEHQIIKFFQKSQNKHAPFEITPQIRFWGLLSL